MDVLLPAHPSSAVKERPKITDSWRSASPPGPNLGENSSYIPTTNGLKKEDQRENGSVKESSVEKAGKFSLQFQEFFSSKEAWMMASRLTEKGLNN